MTEQARSNRTRFRPIRPRALEASAPVQPGEQLEASETSQEGHVSPAIEPAAALRDEGDVLENRPGRRTSGRGRPSRSTRARSRARP